MLNDLEIQILYANCYFKERLGLRAWRRTHERLRVGKVPCVEEWGRKVVDLKGRTRIKLGRSGVGAGSVQVYITHAYCYVLVHYSVVCQFIPLYSSIMSPRIRTHENSVKE